MKKRRTHWWMTVEKTTGKCFGLHGSRAVARGVIRDTCLKNHKPIKVVQETEAMKIIARMKRAGVWSDKVVEEKT